MTKELEKVAEAMNHLRELSEQVVWEAMKALSENLDLDLVEPESRAVFKLVVSDSAEARAESEESSIEEEDIPDPEPIDLTHLPDGLTKFKTEKGWYIKVFIEVAAPEEDIDDEAQEERQNRQRDLEVWLCSVRTDEQREADDQFGLVMWIQALPKRISGRSRDKRDRSYPTSKKTGVYVNDTEMAYLEKVALEQEVPVHEKEFSR